MSEETQRREPFVVTGEGYIAEIIDDQVIIQYEDGMEEEISCLRSRLRAREKRLFMEVILFSGETFLKRVRRAGLIEAIEGERGNSSNTILLEYESVEDGPYRLVQCPEGVVQYDEDDKPVAVLVGRNRRVRKRGHIGAGELAVEYTFPVEIDADPLMDQTVKEGNVEAILSILDRRVTYYPPCNP